MLINSFTDIHICFVCSFVPYLRAMHMIPTSSLLIQCIVRMECNNSTLSISVSNTSKLLSPIKEAANTLLSEVYRYDYSVLLS